jgi:hypothetical protein
MYAQFIISPGVVFYPRGGIMTMIIKFRVVKMLNDWLENVIIVDKQKTAVAP